MRNLCPHSLTLGKKARSLSPLSTPAKMKICTLKETTMISSTFVVRCHEKDLFSSFSLLSAKRSFAVFVFYLFLMYVVVITSSLKKVKRKNCVKSSRERESHVAKTRTTFKYPLFYAGVAFLRRCCRRHRPLSLLPLSFWPLNAVSAAAAEIELSFEPENMLDI